MASRTHIQDVGAAFSRPLKRHQGGKQRGGRRPEGRWPYLWPLRACAATPPACCPLPAKGRWGMALGACWGAVKAVGLGREGGVGAPPDAA